MGVISVFCKKGGVGKTTILGYLAHYYAKKGEKVLIISIDDQNSIFPIYGCAEKIDDQSDNFLEHLIAEEAELGDIMIGVREDLDLYLVKTLNTDTLSRKLNVGKKEEKKIESILDECSKYFNYIFIDFPPSSSRLTETLLEFSDDVILIVGLDTLALHGYRNTIQYFVDTGIDVDKIKYILPNGYSKIKRAAKTSYSELLLQVEALSPNAKILPPLKEIAGIKNLQDLGCSVYDEVEILKKQKEKSKIEEEKLSDGTIKLKVLLSRADNDSKKEIENILNEIFVNLNLTKNG